jgi:hypothetical protein
MYAGDSMPVGIGGALLLWALLPFNPYGFYVFLMLAICGLCLCLASEAHSAKKTGLVWLFIGLALLYNPIIRVHLDREIWAVLNVLTVAGFGSFAWENALDRQGGQ